MAAFFWAGVKAGVTAQQAQASLNVLTLNLGTEFPDTDGSEGIELFTAGIVIPQLRILLWDSHRF